MIIGIKAINRRKYTDIAGPYNEARENQKYREAYEKELKEKEEAKNKSNQEEEMTR